MNTPENTCSTCWGYENVNIGDGGEHIVLDFCRTKTELVSKSAIENSQNQENA